MGQTENVKLNAFSLFKDVHLKMCVLHVNSFSQVSAIAELFSLGTFYLERVLDSQGVARIVQRVPVYLWRSLGT